ncbi:MAG: type II secretion system minor pseudopilin GspK, partial [Psychrobacter sp.]|nr:type II secretion system minor pseudopilin GspK [Psychrobacter sp.]
MSHLGPFRLNAPSIAINRSVASLKVTPSVSSQRGVALLTILLLVVSITVVAGAMLASQKVAIRKSSLLFEQDQLLQDINAGEQLAVALISADSKLNDTDSSKDIWAQPIPPYPMGTHVLTIEITDAASRFNINNLYHDGQADSAALAAFKRLLAQLNLPESIAVAVLDWQDPDSQVYEDKGDEAVVYRDSGASTGINSNGSQVNIANQPFVSIDQLIEVSGMTNERLAALRPYITAVPYYVPINVNTAEPPVLAAVVEGGSSEQMQAIVSGRQSQAIASLEALWQLPPFNGMEDKAKSAVANLVSVESNAFMGLISATEAEGSFQQAPRQRYATVLISKLGDDKKTSQGPNGGAEDQNGSKQNPDQGATNTNQDKGSENKAKIVTAFSQRLWPYRP